MEEENKKIEEILRKQLDKLNEAVRKKEVSKMSNREILRKQMEIMLYNSWKARESGLADLSLAMCKAYLDLNIPVIIGICAFLNLFVGIFEFSKKIFRR